MHACGLFLPPCAIMAEAVAEAQPAAKPIRTVVIMFAMHAEAAPIVEHLALKSVTGVLPPQVYCSHYSGEAHGVTLHVVTSGVDARYGVDSVGTVPAAVATFAALTALQPDLLLNAGTAGGFKARGGAVGDVYISSALRNHDRRIELPVFDQYGIWEVASPPATRLIEALGLKSGVVSSGNSLNCGPEDRAALEASGASIKEMEGAAIAYVAHLFGTPLLAVKAITDIVDGGRVSAEEFSDNLESAAQALQRTLPKVIEFVAGKTMAEL